MIPVIELFYSIQGEGLFAGVPHLFIRVAGCNLRCVFKDSICDTPYSSFNPEKALYKDMDELYNAMEAIFKKHPNLINVCITGGEPMLYQKEVIEIIKKFPDMTYTIETNGSIDTCDEFKELLDFYDIYMSISPKLSTSEDRVGKLPEKLRLQHNKNRINKENLKYWNSIIEFAEAYFKFVYSGPESVEEIKQLVAEGIIDDNSIYLMPEGSDPETLNKNRQECVQVCLDNGWNYTDRLQIIIWGTKRGV